MGKKQRARKLKRLAQRRQGSAPPSSSRQDIFAGPISPQAQVIVNRLARLPDVPEERALRWIMDSAELRDEEEFWNLHFDDAETARVMDRVLPRYTARLERAAKVSEDNAQELYDQARIEMIDLLATREFRRDFLARYDEMLKRMLVGTETDKLEMALFLRPLLDEKRIPWGIIGLIVQIFGESQERIMAPHRDAEDLADELRAALGSDARAEELLQRIQDTASSDLLVELLEAHPELDTKIEEHLDERMSRLEAEVASGVYDLKVFGPEEAARTIGAITRYSREHNIDPDTADPEFMRARMDELIAEALNDIVTPERLDSIRDELQDQLKSWERSKHPRALVLKMEIESLGEEEPAEDLFLQALYRGAMLKLGHALSQVARKLDQEEGEPPRAAGLRERIRSTFKRVR